MSNETGKKGGAGSYASPPCLAHEIDPAYFDPMAVDPEQAHDVARWRKAKRQELLAARKTRSVEEHGAASQRIADRVAEILQQRFNGAKGLTFSAYWPIKGEPNLRPLMETLHHESVRIALPVVVTKAAPLEFRLWTPEMKMVRGDWNIPVPPDDAPVLRPHIALAPLVGWDRGLYRLGYGGGYFDRTLAALDPPPFKIGVGYASAELETIFPQPHDIPMDMIVTEDAAFPAGHST
ncbi:5-formyltetrahydrofolate cyclo-ligase [Roseovarius sp. S1116L3]|uniref:5-formyltetrahydrofolate cyclo-ligase n=1 Tax=Roseovarius roseus TaxID=3342636 RepID=UPI0037276F04